MDQTQQMSAAITISETDCHRIRELLASGSRLRYQAVALLEKKLEIANVVRPDRMPPDVITLNSRVRVHEALTDTEYGFALVIPCASNRTGDVSVLAPVGAAALGLKTGQEIFWYGQSGHRINMRILHILYQPEANGHYHL